MNHTSLSGKYKTRPSSSKTYTQLPDCLVSPLEVLEAASSKDGNHSWQRTRQPKQPRTTVYKLFRVQYLPTVPNQYPKYTIPSARSLHYPPPPPAQMCYLKRSDRALCTRDTKPLTKNYGNTPLKEANRRKPYLKDPPNTLCLQNTTQPP